MAKSRGRKAKTRNQQSLPARPEQTRWQLLRKKLLSPWGLLVEIAGVCASLLAFWGIYVLTIPEIRPTGNDPAAPFLFPFSVRNDSTLFAMKNVKWTCLIKRMEFGVGNIMVDSRLASGGIAKIEPGGVENYRCSIGLPRDSVKLLSIAIRVDYQTLLWSRSYTVPFFWLADAPQPQWIEGTGVR